MENNLGIASIQSGAPVEELGVLNSGTVISMNAENILLDLLSQSNNDFFGSKNLHNQLQTFDVQAPKIEDAQVKITVETVDYPNTGINSTQVSETQMKEPQPIHSSTINSILSPVRSNEQKNENNHPQNEKSLILLLNNSKNGRSL